jgi:hypothetical protein
LEPEVRLWLAGPDDRDFGRVDFMVGLLAEQPELLGEPYSRHLAARPVSYGSGSFDSRHA